MCLLNDMKMAQVQVCDDCPNIKYMIFFSLCVWRGSLFSLDALVISCVLYLVMGLSLLLFSLVEGW